MKKLYSLIVMAFMASTVLAQVDYTPTFTGTRTHATRKIAKISLTGDQGSAADFVLDETQKTQEYVDVTASQTFIVQPGETITITVERDGTSDWVNHYVYIDVDADGFTADINRDGYTPGGDLVAYSFYNNGATDDANGWNSVGTEMSGDIRSFPAIPSFTVTDVNGTYRMRVKQDWCSIDPMGDSDSNFGGNFTYAGGQIIDFMLQVGDDTTPEPDPELSVENVEVEKAEVVIYDLTGRRVKEIVKPGIYIINGNKVLVK